MEKKTIGGFIAALRKANGMTQRELAEKLNVSDKTVSRWERDDSAPDLTLIPVIAEIFEVTCDELLRGERKPASERTEQPPEDISTPKGEKQRRLILNSCLYRYKTRTLISAGLSVIGLIAAMTCNLGFIRARIGFMAGSVFYLTSVICQMIFINGALFSVAGDDMEESGQYKRAVVKLAERSLGLTVILLGATLPLITCVDGAYVGLSASYWTAYGALYGFIAFLIVGAACHFIDSSLIKRGVWNLSESEGEIYQHNGRLKRRCAAALLLIMGGTFFTQFLLNESGPRAFVKGTVFNDYESFVEYMERDTSSDAGGSAYVYADNRAEPAAPAPGSEIHYYDEYGNEITEEEALLRTLVDKNGEVLCEYVQRNDSVVSIRYSSGDGTVLPITVFTNSDYIAGNTRLNIANGIYAVLYCIETAAVLAVYFRKRLR